MNLDLVDAIVVVVGVGVGVEVEVEIEIDSVFLFPTSGFLIMIFPKPRKTFPSLVFRASAYKNYFFELLELNEKVKTSVETIILYRIQKF